MNALDELKNKLRAGGGRSLTALELAVLFAREITVAEHERAAAELAALRARVGELEQERDAAVSDLQDAVDFVYKVYGESNETLAAITTGHWRAVIASAKGAK